MIRILALALVSAAGLTISCAPSSDIEVSVPGVTEQGLDVTTVLAPTADTYVRRNSPYSAYGLEGLLRVGTADRRKTIIRFDSASIAAALQGRQLVSAKLELLLGGGVTGFTSGQALVAQPLAQPFVETRATYSCANDAVTTNWASDCVATDVWNLDTAPFPWRNTGIPVPLVNGQTGTVTFDVTNDIADVLAGTHAPHGWLVLRTNDTATGDANFRSREDISGPRLVIVTTPAVTTVCGNGVLEASEGCDDGNTIDGDGCSACVVDFCGDALVNNAGIEQCDDGNTVVGDGCSACVIDFCGDALVNNAGIEQCDDGNATIGDGCSACVIDFCGDALVNNGGAESCDDANSVNADGCTACALDVCGDGIINNNGAEGCDDGNSIPGDGCTACVVDVCGDGLMNNGGTELCDDGGRVDGDGCSTSCALEYGYACSGEPSSCGPDCGDGIVLADLEECDDSGNQNADGCSSSCSIEGGFSCSGAPSDCVRVCGNGVLDEREGCEDGNLLAGDGCSEVCLPEPGTIDRRVWITDGAVNTSLIDNGVLYIGGKFNQLGPWTGGLASIDTATGARDRQLPLVDGVVDAIVSDGSAGWFIGGRFTTVGGMAHANMAHVASDGRVSSTNFDTDGPVRSFLIAAGRLYVGGEFNYIAGLYRTRLAAIDIVTKNLTSWSPRVSATSYSNATVNAIDVNAAGDIVIGGMFEAVGALPRTNLAIVRKDTGQATSWVSSTNAPVNTVLVNGTTLYVGGIFTLIKSASRTGLGSVSLSTGAVTSWNPAPDNIVSALSRSGSTLYVGGLFKVIGGQTRHGIAAISTSTGLATSWNPAPVYPGYVGTNVLVRSGSTLFAGGTFVNSATRRLAAIDTTTGVTSSWRPSPNSGVNAIGVSGTSVVAGGDFKTIGTFAQRTNLAAIDLSTGLPTPWAPIADGEVTAMDADAGRLYVAGQFSHLSGATRGKAGALDIASGAPLPWSPISTMTGGSALPNTIAVDSGVVYVGGSFTAVNATPRNNLVAFDAMTGSLASWNPNANGTVQVVAPSGTGIIYVGGSFTLVGGLARNRLAAVTAAGALTGWAPASDDTVYNIVSEDSVVSVVGAFTTIAGASRTGIAQLSPASGLVTSFVTTNTSRSVRAVLPETTSLFFGGYFSSGDFRGVRRVDNSGATLPWTPRWDWISGADSARTLSADAAKIYLGGQLRGPIAFAR